MKNIKRNILLKYYLSILFIASTAYLQAQTTHTGNITINADGEGPGNVTTLTRIDGDLTIGGTIMEFPNFANLEVVVGNLVIEKITTGSLIALNNIFPALDSVYGNFFIQDNNLVQTISGFAELDSVGAILRLRRNKVLTAYPSFAALKGTKSSIRIERNLALTAIPPFAALTNTGGVYIDNNAELTTLPPFAALTHAGFLTIQNNAKLENFSGFGALETITNSLSINNNLRLTAIPSFAVLKSVNASIIISTNAALETISGFDALTSVDVFTIQSNAALETISGFAALMNITGSLNVSSNPMLSSCCGLLRVANGSVMVLDNLSGNNAEGCNSNEEIKMFCTLSAALTITQNSDVPSGSESITRITGNLTIGGTITEFPDFADLEVVEGDLIIDGITTGSLTALDNIFPSLDSVRGSLFIQNNEFVKTITGFVEFERVGGSLNIGTNAALTAVPAFDDLAHITDAIIIQNNAALTAIPSFSTITTTGRLSDSNECRADHVFRL